MFVIYDLIFLVIATIYLPIYLFKRKFHRGLFLRLGILPKDLELDRPIWLHAVSVGEVMAIRGLLEELRRAHPNRRFVISTVTSTGNKVAQVITRKGDFVTYLPLDLSFITRGVLDRIKPLVFIIAETEIWPNLISYLYIRNIPSIIVNGRISDRSFRGYLAIKFLLKPILNKINLFCVQTSRDSQRLIRLGVAQNKIKVTGNMKFDITDYTDKKHTDDTDKYRASLGLSYKDKLWVAASTHPGEEAIILGAYRKLLNEFPNLRLLIAPRHPERVGRVEKLITQHNFKSMRISQLGPPPATYQLPPIFILDSVGQLLSFYAIADIVFVGGSLVRVGGHNILEPASLGKPVLFGPHMHNFSDIADLFIHNKAAISVKNQGELIESIKNLLSKPSLIIDFRKRSKELILQNQGATRKNIECIHPYTS